jgi:RHS repeat-associated protein
VEGATFKAPATITLTASANNTDGRIAKVEFFEGANLLATVTTRPYTFTLNGVQAGNYSFTAVATDNRGLITTSSAVNITVTSGAAQLFFIYTDQLNTPRVITDQANKVVWRWDNNDPFGGNIPDEDPDGDGIKFICNLRFPGQYADRETGMNYNYFRDYDPNTGRYIQSDPVGLDGGINTYMYVLGNPLAKRDFFGLDTCGSSFLEGLVPDNPFLFPFSSCCRNHDNCYDNCFSQPTKSECDDRFCGCMKSRCQRYGNVRGFCEWTAQKYCDAVVSKGQPAFEDARQKCKGPGCQR